MADTKLREWRSQEHLRTPKDVADYLAEVLHVFAEGGPDAETFLKRSLVKCVEALDAPLTVNGCVRIQVPAKTEG